MAGAVLVPCLVQLRTDLNNLCPGRDKASDGAAGDTAHQARVSDHNNDETGRVPIRDADSKPEYHAVDLDDDLRTPGLTMEMIVQHTLARCRSGAEKRLRYIIYRRRIWEASNGWRERPYNGDNGHFEHAHFSASYETKLEASTASWRLEDIPVALTEADRTWLLKTIKEEVARGAKDAAAAVWATKKNIERQVGKPAVMAELGAVVANIPSEHGGLAKAIATPPPPAG